MKSTITVIEDDMDLRSLLEMALSLKGFYVRSYANAQEFMTSNTANPSALYVIDINLGGMNGYELCSEIRKDPATKDSIIILISANPDLPQLAAHAGADDHMIKPFSQKVLLERITELLAGSDYLSVHGGLQA
jgi:two-component system response regulator ChvI